MFTLPTQPSSIGETLDHSFKLYATGLNRVFGLSAMGSMVSEVTMLVLVLTLVGAAPTEQDAPQVVGAAMTGTMLASLLSMPFFLAVVARLWRIGQGDDLSMGNALRIGLSKTAAVIVAGFLYGMAIMLGLVVLVIPGLILIVSLWFYAMAIVIDGHGIIGSLKQSHQLVWNGNWWRTATVATVGVLIFSVAVIGATMVAGMLDVALGFDNAANLLTPSTFIGIVINALFTPYIYALFIVTYHDLKLRRAGDDLERRLDQIEA